MMLKIKIVRKLAIKSESKKREDIHKKHRH